MSGAGGGTAGSVTENGFQNVSNDSLIFFEQVDGAAVNTNVWMPSVSGQTITQAGGFITLNAGGAVTANAYSVLQSIKNIPLYGHYPLLCTINAKFTRWAQANATVRIGIGVAVAGAVPTDGAYFVLASDGTMRCVINNNGVETTSAAIDVPADVTDVRIMTVEIVEDLVNFYYEDNLVCSVDVPLGQAFPFNVGRQRIFAQVVNGSSPPALAPGISIGQVIVSQQVINQNKLWKEALATLGRGAYQSPVTPFTQTANHANSTGPVSATLANATAGYATLGGRFQFAAVAGAVTDFALFAYQVPAGYQLYVTGLTISSLNIGATVGATSTILDWALGLNGSAIDLATAESPPTSWATRRIPIGTQSFAALGIIGLAAPDIVRVYDPPLIVDSGRFLHIIMACPVGLATASQIIRGNAMIQGYFE